MHHSVIDKISPSPRHHHARPQPSGPWLPVRGFPRAQIGLGGLHCADVIVAEIEGAVHISALERAMRAVAARHAVLRARLRLTPDQAGNLSASYAVDAVAPDPAPISAAPGEWRGAVRAALEEALGGDGPVWHLRFVPGPSCFHLILAVHHAFVDGRSLSALLRDLLRALDGQTLGEPLPFPTDVAEIWQPPGWLQWAAKALRYGWAWRVARAQAQTPFRGATVGRGERLPTVFGALTLGEGLIPQVAERARAQGATVGGAFAAAAWAATRALAGQRSAAGSPIEAMVDLRAILPCAPEVGMFAGGALALRRAAPEDPWQRAREATRRMSRQIAWKLPLLPHILADGVEDAAGWLAGRGVDLERDGGCGAASQISNVGLWKDGVRFGSRRLRAVWSAAAAIRTGPALLAWLRTVDGRGCLSVVGNGAVISGPEVDAWMAAIAAALQEMAGSARG